MPEPETQNRKRGFFSKKWKESSHRIGIGIHHGFRTSRLVSGTHHQGSLKDMKGTHENQTANPFLGFVRCSTRRGGERIHN
jgi:hypothetical protein